MFKLLVILYIMKLYAQIKTYKSGIALENKIRRDTELFYEANKRKEKGQTYLAAFVLNK